MSHVLLSRSHRFPAASDPEPVGWRYCRELGAWLPESGDGPSRTTELPRPTSKKQDIETGEDMKGA